MKNNDYWLPMPRFLLRKDTFRTIIKNHSIKNKNCLEIGFGSGEILKLLAKNGANVTGFDFSQQAISLAMKRVSTHSYSSRISITHDEKTLLEKSYDYVLAFEVLEHIQNDQETFDKWLSYLKPGGSLIISVPAHMSKWCENDIWAGHVRRYEKHELLNLCNRSNVHVEHLWNYGFPLTIILDKLLERERKKNKNDTIIISDKIKSTQKSGIDRKNKIIYKLLSNDIFMYVFYLLQRPFYKHDLGSGYIFHVIKNV